MRYIFLLTAFLFAPVASSQSLYPIGQTPTVIVSAASMTSTVTSPWIPILGVSNIDCQPLWTGTPNGTFAVNISQDQLSPDPLTLSAVITASGSPGHGSIELTGLASPFFQIVYTPSSSTGTLTITCFAKVRS